VEFRVGCSGWSYRHWRGAFYPAGVATSRWFDAYAAAFDTVEVNSSFYRLPSTGTLRDWRERAPDGFRFAMKASRLITHNKRLADSADLLDAFFARVRTLGERLGPVLYQLPPAFQRDDARLAAFLERLPPELLHVFEFRHPSWWDGAVYALLRAHGAGFCIYNMGDVTTPLVTTCGDAYVRFHGPQQAFASGYADRELASWAQRIAGLEAGRAWIYFNNDVGGHAPRDALRLRDRLDRLA
jgi:uncharacterized protein YecE (DUF72 family)